MDGTSRVYADLSIVCYKGAHFFWTYGVALPSIIVWGVGIPFFAYLLLLREKHKLGTLELREKFGFLYNGYKKQFFYWETLIMYRKLSLVIIAVIISSYGVITQVRSTQLFNDKLIFL